MANKKSSTSSKTKTTKKIATKKAPVKAAPKRKTVHATEPYHPGFGVILVTVCAIMLAVLLPFAIKMVIRYTESDAMRFSEEYSEVDAENIYKFKTSEEIEKILEHGTGVVFFGFPSCPWCQSYAPMLNSLAKAYSIEEIAYYDIKADREQNSEFYQKLVSILSDRLQHDNDGEKRIYVPEVVFVVDGEIIGNDHETSKDTLGLKDPKEYWTDERVAALYERLRPLFEKVKAAAGCTTSCNE